jgi:hypothetical protein
VGRRRSRCGAGMAGRELGAEWEWEWDLEIDWDEIGTGNFEGWSKTPMLRQGMGSGDPGLEIWKPCPLYIHVGWMHDMIYRDGGDMSIYLSAFAHGTQCTIRSTVVHNRTIILCTKILQALHHQANDGLVKGFISSFHFVHPPYVHTFREWYHNQSIINLPLPQSQRLQPVILSPFHPSVQSRMKHVQRVRRGACRRLVHLLRRQVA